MIRDFREQVRRVFQRELDSTPAPPDLAKQVFRATFARRAFGRQLVRQFAPTAAVLTFLLLVGIVAFALRTSRLVIGSAPAASPAAGLVSSPTADASPSPTASPSQTYCRTSVQKGCLTVTPSSGPVGTVVVLEGSGCNNPGQLAYFAFESSHYGTQTGTEGAVDIPNVPVDGAGHFRITFSIPQQLHALQQHGGGRVLPGTYSIDSLPILCQATFTVTSG